MTTTRRAVLAMGATAVAVAMAIHAAAPDGVVADVSYLGGMGVAAALAWLGVTRCGRGQRAAWAWIALGVTLSASADLTYYVQGWVWGIEPDVSVADVPWVGSYVALAAGLMLLNPARRGRIDVDALIDSLVACVVALLLLWEAAVADIVGDTSTPVLTRAVWSAYPVLDVVLLALVIRAAIERRRGMGPALAVVSAGTVCWLAADFGFLVDADGGAARWLDLGWMLALLLLGAGALCATPRPAGVDAPRPVGLVRGRMWPVMWPLLLPSAIELGHHLRDQDADATVPLIATAALVALAAARGQRLLRQAEEARAAVAAREHRFRTLTENSADAVVVVDGEGRIRDGSRNLARLVGIDPDFMLGVPITDAPEVAQPPEARALLAKALAAPGAVLADELSVVHRDGRQLCLAARVVNLLDDPVIGGIVVNLHDVTDRKRAEQELVHQAFHDGLTGLANRALFTDRVEQAVRRSARSGGDPAVIFLDVDGFKTVNDRFGHAAGDTLLREVAERLARVVRSGDTVARLGGDELAVLIEEHHLGADEAGTTAQRILQALSVPVELEGQLIAVTASIGVAVGDASSTAGSLLRDADIAMYRAKAAGKAQVVVYDSAMGAEAGEVARMQSDLASAAERDQLVLLYQPVIDLADDRVVGFEALVRWRHPELGVLAPDRFIPLAEETGLIVPVGRWVLETACRAAARWVAAGHPDLTVAVNLSGRQIASDDMVDHVRGALADSGLAPRNLVLEMTETALVADAAAAARRLQALRGLGVRLAVDDFGTGYSSLSYLRQFPIDILKIDRSFVETITEDAQIPPIVRGLLDLGHTLDLEIVAEGIERDVQRSWLRDAHCDLGQGFLFARPLPEDQADALLVRGAPSQIAGRR